MVLGEKHVPEQTSQPESALGVIKNPEHSIGSAIEAIKSPAKRNLFEASSLFVAKEALDVNGYEQEGGGFNEDLLRARVEQTVLPDGSRPTVEMVRDWFEAKKELTRAILDGKVDVGRPITQQNQGEAAYFRALAITRQQNPAATEPHITDPEENRRIFEEAADELESVKVRDLSLVVENWDDLVRLRAHQLSEVREGKQTQIQDLNEFLKESTKKEEEARPEEKPQPLVGPEEPSEGGPQPPAEEGEAPAEPTEETVPTAQEETAEPQEAGEEPEKEAEQAEEEEEEQEEEEKQPEAEGEEEAEEPQKPEEKKEEKKQGFVGKVGGFIKNWWKSVSPQGRNKLYWGLGVGVGAAETLFIRGSLTPILGPAASWAVSGANSLILNGLNYRVQRGITEAKANQDLEKIQKLEAQYKKTADFFAGVAAGSIGAAVGDALWNGLVAPRLPQIQEGVQGLGKQFGIGAEATSPPIMGETASPPAPTPEIPAMPTPAETPTPKGIGAPPLEASQPTTPVSGLEAVVPAETTKYVVAPGDTLTEILDKNGYNPYGKSLTEIIVKNADVLRERALNDAQRQAIDQLVANPNWSAIDDKEKWKIIMRAGHWIFPGQELILPVKP